MADTPLELGNSEFYPTTTRSQQLQTLSKQMPGQLAQQAQQQQGAREAGLQQAVQQATQGAGQATAGQLQATGAAQAQQRGAIALQTAQLGAQRQGQIGALGLQEQYMADQQELSNKHLALQQENQQLQNQLANKNVQLKQELFDKQMQFQKDSLGRTMFNERQLLDWQVSKAQSHEDLLNYEQQATQTSKRRQQMLQQSYLQVTNALKNANEQWQNTLNQQQKEQLTQAKNALEMKIKQEAAAQKNRAGMFGAIGTLIGAGGGAILGGTGGAMAGAGIGGGLGQIAAGTT